MNEDNEKIVGQEGVHIVCNGAGELRAILRRDPVSGKHLFYFVKEGTSDEIADFIKTNTNLPKQDIKKEEGQ